MQKQCLKPFKTLRISLLTAISAVALSSHVCAADVGVRTGAHEEYSRLVFDWQSTTEYTIKRDQKDTLVIEFSKDAGLNTAAAQSNPVANIGEITILSENPLRVSVKVPEGSRTRDLRAGNKIVVDVYHPADGPQKQTTLSVNNQSTSPLQEEPPEVEPTQEALTEEEPAEELAQATPPEPQPIQLEMGEEPTIFTVSSTKNFGMAAFNLEGHLWLVNDKSDLLIKPQLSGPGLETLGEMTEVTADHGNAYYSKIPQGVSLQGRGGGVLWRVLLGQSYDIAKAAKPVRADVDRAEMRSGKLMWPMKGATSILNFKDPVTGRDIIAVTVTEASDFAGPAQEFVDFEVLESPIGLAIVSKVPDLQVTRVRGGIEISRPAGLSLVEESIIASMAPLKTADLETPDDQIIMTPADVDTADTGVRIFDFKAWQLGGLPNTYENKRIILGNLREQSKLARSENLITLAKMYISNAMAPEALGVLNFAVIERKDLWDNPEFTALYGVGSALTHRNEEAYEYLSQEILDPFKEIRFWRAFVLADEGDWEGASETLPRNLSTLYDYPVLLQNRIVPSLAEIALRQGDLERTAILLDIAKANEKSMEAPQQAYLQYLLGEAARQEGNTEETIKAWEPLTKGKDDLFRTRAGLALARLKVDEGEIKPEEAIDDLERLRYAWRGDELEVQINYWLGKTYFESGQYLRGLTIMRDAVGFDPGNPLAQRVAGEMADMFSELFLSPELETVSPLDAVSLYDEFKELVPLDERGNEIVERLAERLVQADLLGRAGNLLKYQLDHRLEGFDIYRIGMRVAAIRLLDNQPDAAIDALNVAAAKLQELPEELRTEQRFRDVSLLRARALSRKGRPDQALALLNDLNRTPDMNRLRADIAWTAGYWDDAAEALGDVILDQNISLTRPLNEENTALLLQQAIALNLAGDRIALANMREKYTDLMVQTPKAKVFEVITRPRQSGALADRETLLSVVSEVDLFQEFLDSYKSITTPVN